MKNWITDIIKCEEATKEDFLKGLHERILLPLREHFYDVVDNEDAYLHKIKSEVAEKEQHVVYDYNGQLLQPNFEFSLEAKTGTLHASLESFKRYDLFSDESETISLHDWLKEQ